MVPCTQSRQYLGGLRRDVISFSQAMGKGSWHWALQHYVKATEMAVQPDLQMFNILLAALCSTGARWARAFDLLRLRCQADSVTWNTLLQGVCGEASRRSRSTWALGLTLVAWEVVSFNIILAAMKGSTSQWPWTLQLLRSMSQAELRKDVVTFSSAVTTSRPECQRWHQSWHHLQQMDAQTVVSNVVMLGTVGNAVATALRWKDAVTLLRQLPLRTLRLNVILHSSVMAAIRADTSWTKGLWLLQRGEEVNLRLNTVLLGASLPDSWQGAIGCFQRSRKLQQTGDLNAMILSVQEWSQGLALLMTCRSLALEVAKSKARHALLNSCSDSQLWQRAVGILSENQKINDDVSAFTATLMACERARQRVQSALVLEDMRRASVEFDRVMLTVAFSSMTSWELALQHMSQKRMDFMNDPLLQSAAVSTCEVFGQWRAAISMLEDAMSVKETMPSASAATPVVNATLAVCQRVALWMVGMRLLLMTQQEGIEVDVLSWTSVIGSINGSAWKWSIRMLRSMCVHRLEPSLLSLAEATSSIASAPPMLLEDLQRRSSLVLARS